MNYTILSNCNLIVTENFSAQVIVIVVDYIDVIDT